MRSGHLAPVRVRVPGKINLYLSVGPRRRDGYHDLVTVFHAVDLADEVVAVPWLGLEVAVRGDDAEAVPTDARNLAWQAATLLAEHAEVAPHARLEITKRIPVAGGMAGGSADAAGALVACAALWRTGTSRSQLHALAAQLGSDAAFPLVGGTALGTGRGERLSPVLATGRFHWVLAIADRGLPTATVYRELDRQRDRTRGRPSGPPEAVLDALRSGDPHRLAPTLANELQPATVRLAPALRRTLAAGRELGALAGLVSGSGPTCAFLTDGADAATRLAAALAAEGVCRMTRVASGPAPGARVVPADGAAATDG